MIQNTGIELGVWRMLIVQLCKVDQLSSQKQSDSVWHLSSLSSNTLKSVFVFQLTKLPVYQIHHKPWLFSLRAPPGMPKRPLLCVEVTQHGIECEGRQLGHTAFGSGSGTGPDYDLEMFSRRGCHQLVMFTIFQTGGSMVKHLWVQSGVLSCFIKCETEKERVSMF